MQPARQNIPLTFEQYIAHRLHLITGPASMPSTPRAKALAVVASGHCKESAIAGVPVQVHSDFPKGAFCIVYQRDDTADGWSQTRKYAMEGFFTTQR